MAETTPRLSLPLLEAGQAQKELFHNEALALLDIAVAAGVQGVGLDTPPAMPMPGQCWVVGTGPTGDWADRADAIAGWTANGWRFVAPHVGMVVWSIADRLEARFDDTGWTLGQVVAAQVMIGGVAVLGTRAPAIDSPGGGATVDVQARTAIDAILTALRGHGLIS
jgi:hypothetical protein